MEVVGGSGVWTNAMGKHGGFAGAKHDMCEERSFDMTDSVCVSWLDSILLYFAAFHEATECTTFSPASAGFYRTESSIVGHQHILEQPDYAAIING